MSRSRSYPLTRARSLAPAAFRRWTLGGIGIAVIGYSAFAFLDLESTGFTGFTETRHAIMAVFALAALIFAMKVDEVVGCAATILATWIEVQSAFHDATTFPAGGMLVLPVLVLAIGLLFGARISLVAAIASFFATYFCFRLGPTFVNGELPPDSTYWFLMYAVSMFSVWGLLALGLSGFTRVFDEMMASRKELADALQFSPDGIVVVGQDGKILLANPAAARLLRASESELIGAHCPLVIATLIGDLSLLPKMEAACRTPSGEMAVQFAGDPVTHIEASWRSMDGGRHQLRLRDITRRVTAEEQRVVMEAQLAHAQRMDAVGRLAGGLSHDFNNILTAVSGSAELLRRARDDAERQELINEIIDARDRGTSLTRQLLSFSRRDVRQPRVLDVGDAVRGMERLLGRVAGEQVTLTFDLADDCRISADPGQLEHALVNLVANARDAMPSGGTCTIRVRNARPIDGAPQVELSVRDTGTGMPDEVAARAFEPFFTTKPRGQGTGLGLASVHAMVTQCNGTARIDSSPGNGTTITLEIPGVVELVSESRPPVLPTLLSAGTHRILVAEDDGGTRRVVERLLTSAGYSVHLCVDGRAAMAAVDDTTLAFDLVLSDIMMPGHTGPEVAARVAQVRPGTPVLLMSGYAEDYLGGVLNDGVRHEVIAKPFSGHALTTRIAELLQAASPVS